MNIETILQEIITQEILTLHKENQNNAKLDGKIIKNIFKSQFKLIKKIKKDIKENSRNNNKLQKLIDKYNNFLVTPIEFENPENLQYLKETYDEIETVQSEYAALLKFLVNIDEQNTKRSKKIGSNEAFGIEILSIYKLIEKVYNVDMDVYKNRISEIMANNTEFKNSTIYENSKFDDLIELINEMIQQEGFNTFKLNPEISKHRQNQARKKQIRSYEEYSEATNAWDSKVAQTVDENLKEYKLLKNRVENK